MQNCNLDDDSKLTDCCGHGWSWYSPPYRIADYITNSWLATIYEPFRHYNEVYVTLHDYKRFSWTACSV